jgi:glycine cleavage system H protein
LRYTASHEWIRVEDDGTAFIGITDHAQEAMGDLVYVDLPDIGTLVAAGDDVGVVESVKAASDIYAPISGEILAVNEALTDTPEVVNTDPYGDGWLFQIQIADESELAALLSAEDYEEKLSEEDEDD